ncbi:MAG: hypothetical protein H0X41_11175 [Chitinophagaceae bacterium]|nr:hypothetical protein [Chitinophagaceae bacterium]
MKQVLLEILSVATVLSFFVPLLIVLLKKLLRDPFFMSFAIYWATSGVLGLIDFIPAFPKHISQTIGAVYNMLDIPIVLGILYYTSTSLLVKKFTSIAFIFYVLLEAAGVVIKGVNYEALKYPLATGLALVMIVIGWEIIRYLQKVEHSNRQNAKVLIYAALIFEYACYIVVYIVDYFTTETDYQSLKPDMFLIYYISSLIGILIASSGYLIHKKYKKKEPLINEVKIDII